MGRESHWIRCAHPLPPSPSGRTGAWSMADIVERARDSGEPPGDAAGPPLAQGLEAQDGGRHAHVERLRPPGHGDGDPGVQPSPPARRRDRRPRCRVPGPPGRSSRRRRSRCRPAPRWPTVVNPRDADSAATTSAAGATLDHRDMEERSGRGPHALRVGRVDRAVTAHHGVDPGGVGGADHRAEVARVAHVDAHHHQGRTRRGRRGGPARRTPRPAAAGASPSRRPAPSPPGPGRRPGRPGSRTRSVTSTTAGTSAPSGAT